LAQVLAGDDVGTLFVPPSLPLASRKHWIAYAHKPAGALVVDDGAKDALLRASKSLLPSGISEVRGRFSAGEAVSVLGADGVEFARGLSSYASDDVEKIRGKRTSDIQAVLGYKYLDEVIHRDDLVVL
jgi:glutamate 5-kinase